MGVNPSKFRHNFRTMTSAPKANSENSAGNHPEYKDTVNLPQTDFSMRANAVIKEPEIQKFWQEQGTYEDLIHNNHGDVFTLHDGSHTQTAHYIWGMP